MRGILRVVAQVSVECALKVHRNISFKRHRHSGALYECHAIRTRTEQNLLHALALPARRKFNKQKQKGECCEWRKASVQLQLEGGRGNSHRLPDFYFGQFLRDKKKGSAEKKIHRTGYQPCTGVSSSRSSRRGRGEIEGERARQPNHGFLFFFGSELTV